MVFQYITLIKSTKIGNAQSLIRAQASNKAERVTQLAVTFTASIAMYRSLSNYFRVTKVWPVGGTGKKVTKINRFPPIGSRKAHSEYCVFYDQRLRRYSIESFEN